MRGLILASLVLLQPFSGPWGSAEHPSSERTWCRGPGACYSVHLGSLNFHRAQNACAELGGRLSTASGEAEVQAILALLTGVANGSGASLFWLGLVRKAQQCTLEDLPLRGFSWAPAGIQEATANETMQATMHWVREPSKSCTMQKCAGLQVTLGQPGLQPWGLKEHVCTKASPGYICKYSYAGSCPALPASPGLHYTLPYGLQSATVEFSPPGTVVTLRCPRQEARFTCRLSPYGYHWEGTEQRLCSCPSGYWSPSKGACAEPADCLGARGAFLCLCAWGSRLGTNEKSCAVPAATGGAATARLSWPTPTTSEPFSSNGTSWPGQNSSLEPFLPGLGNSSAGGTEKASIHSDSSNYVFILITVAVVMLVILVMAALQVFQVCFKMCSAKGSQPNKDGVPASVAEGDPEASATRTNSEHSLEPSKAESVETSPEDSNPGAGQVESGQP